MGGKGSGRLNKTQAFLKSNSDPYKSVGNVASVGNEVLVIPNHSGDLSAGRVNTTPTTDQQLVNKKYVDDAFLKNDAADIGVGLKLTGDNGSADTEYVPNVLYNTDATPPTASTVPIGTIYIQYTA